MRRSSKAMHELQAEDALSVQYTSAIMSLSDLFFGSEFERRWTSLSETASWRETRSSRTVKIQGQWVMAATVTSPTPRARSDYGAYSSPSE